MACNGITRHIQLKASYKGASVREQKVHLRLMDKPSGCVIWLLFDADTLQLGPFLWFGSTPGAPLPDITKYPVARHAKGNAQGIKTERPSVRVLKLADFELLGSIPDLVERLFGNVVT